MFRAVVPGLLCLLAAPAAAQPPTPTPPAVPPQPVPIQPVQPQPFQPGGPPQTFVFPAQPTARVQGGGEPRVVVARVVDGALVWKSSGMGPVQRQIDVTVLENGQPVTRKQTVTMMQNTTKDVSVPLDGLKVKDAAGKKVQPLSLEIRLGDGKGIVLHNGPIPDAVRAMFKDDALFVELPLGAGQFAQPAFAPDFFPGGGPAPAPVFRVRPAPVPDAVPLPGPPGLPAPAPPPPAPPRPAPPQP